MHVRTAGDAEMPVLGFGTARLRGGHCRRAVESALELGYRHLDTAQMYENEEHVGAAIADAPVERDEIFLVTKVHRKHLAPEDLITSVETSLDKLGTRIDLLLIHAPSRRVPLAESIDAMNRLQREGDVDHIGVSNFSVEQLESAIDASETPIVTNQVEYHPFKRQDELLRTCIDRGVLLTAYSPLAKGRVEGNETLRDIGEHYGKTEAQVALRWLIQQEMVAAIPKAASETHRRENLEVFDFELTNAEMRRIFEFQGSLLDRLREHLGL